ncbi:replication-relaxation family protein [Bacillus swezeyi]|uniref:replication-relaxation family protein n=1 Tax=Bacillus swezeyi TaxID=1925020 RepID=UPI0016802BDA|nr:replication-relaxation family protein [Bacillus swezeyi]
MGNRTRIIFGSNRKGVYLSKSDFHLLKVLTECQLLTSKQMLTYYLSMEPTATINTIKSKMNRWARYKIVVPFNYRLGQVGSNYNYYRIGSRGVDILVEHRVLGQEWRDKDISKYSKRRNIPHFLATQNIVTTVLAHPNSKYFEGFSPFDTPYLENDKKVILPDWTFVYGYTYLNIELDVGTEVISELRYKFDRYAAIAQQKPDKRFIVLFAVIDHSFPTKENYGEDRSKRIGNIKTALHTNQSLSTPNLHIAVAPLQRATALATQLLEGYRPLSSDQRTKELADLLKIVGDFHDHVSFQLERIENVYPARFNKALQADAAYTLHSLNNSKVKNVLFLLMEEGNIHDLERLIYLHGYLEKDEFLQNIDYIVCCYQDEIELHKDVIGMKLDRVFFTDRNKMLSFNEPLTLYKQVQPYKVEEITVGF